jgi:hypothetical protein
MAKLSQTFKIEGGSNTAPVSTYQPQKLSQTFRAESNNAPISYGSGKLSQTFTTGQKSVLPDLKQNTPTPTIPSYNEEVINLYESIPDANIFQRLFDKKARSNYNVKQLLNPFYEQNKDLQTKQLLSNLGIPDNDIMRQSGNTRAEEKRITSLLSSKGITDKKTIDAVKGYSERLLNQKADTNLTEYADEHPVKGTLLSGLTKVASDIPGTLQNTVDYLSGKALSNSRGANAMTRTTQNMRNAVSDDMSGLGKFAYNVGTSIMDMAPILALGGNAGLGYAGASAMQGSIPDLIDRGLTPNQIMLTSLANGTAEAMLEKLPLGNLEKWANQPIEKTFKSIAKAISSQMISEGIEETGTDLANTIFDALINGNKAELSQNIQKNGFWPAMWDYIKQVGYDGLAGAVSGGVMGGGNAGVNMVLNGVSNNTNGRNTNIPTLEQTSEATTPVEQPTSVSNAPVEAQQTNTPIEAKTPTQEPTAVQTPTEQNGIRVYRGYNRSDNPLETNLAKQKTIYEILGKNNPYEEDYLPLAYFTESEDVANNYAEQNEILLDQLRKGSKESWLLRKQDNELAQPDLPMDEWVEREALKSYKNLTGLDYSKNGNVESRMINPTKVLDISELGEVTNIDDFYKLLARETGVNEQILDDILELGDNVDDWNGVRAYQFLRNEGNGRAGRKVYDFLKELGYDAVRYAEDGTNHWALFDEPQNKVMAEDIGLKKKSKAKEIPTPDSNEATIEASIEDLEDRRNGATYVGRTASNTFRNAEMFNPETGEKIYETRKLIEDQIKNGNADVERQTWLAANKEAVQNLDENGFEKEKQRILESGTETTQTQIAESVYIMDNEINKALKSGDTTQLGTFVNRLVQRMHKVGQALQALRMYGNTASGMALATDSLAGAEVNAFVNDATKSPNGKKAKALKQNAKLAEALKQLGYDGTMEKEVAPKTFEQYKQEVRNTLSRESSSIQERFSDTDIEYLARLLEHGATTEDIKNALNRHFVTGYFGISAEDLQAITDLYNQADQSKSSKETAELRKQAAAIASKYLGKPTLMDKWNAWRYLSMLGNPRTMLRNILGNTTFGAVTDVKDAVGAVLESAFIKDGERTKAILTKADSNLIKACADYFDKKAYEQATEGGHKFNMKHEVEGERQIFKSKLLEGARKLTDKVLEESDNSALKRKYSKALAGYLKANGYDASVLKTDNSILERANEYAIAQAKEATFHADNSVADMLNDWSRSARERGGLGGKIGEVLIESTMPFKKTPANILKQGFEYSPLSLLKLASQVRSRAGANAYIDTISKGLTGSGILALGAWLASRGLLVGKRDDDDDPYKKGSDYALTIGGKSYSLDWTAPAAMPLFVGVELYNHFNPNESADEAKGFFESLASIGEPAIEMSMLEGLSNTLDAISNAKNNKASATAANIISGYVSQAIPTLSGQIARTIDPYRRSTRTNASSSSNAITATLEKSAEKVMNKIPGLSMLNQKYVDVWGNPQKNSGGNILGRAFQNFVSPGYLNDVSLTDREKKLADLQKTYEGSGSLIPTLAKSNKPDGSRMSNAEYEKYSKARGQELQKAVDAALKYKGKSGVKTEVLQDCIHDIENFANYVTEHKQFGKKISDTYKKAYEAYELGGYDGVMLYYLMNKSADLDGNGSITQEELAKYLRSSNIPRSQREDYFKIKFPKAKEIPTLR